MILNYIWIFFFIIAFVVALCKLIFLGDTEVFGKIVDGTFSSAKTAFEVSLGLTGALTLWMGLMKIAEQAGAINFLSRIIGPFFRKLFPEIPKDHPALGQIILNFSANMLGLGNAATPLGLKAMQSMHELNKDKDTASNSQIMFLVLNTAGFTLIPVSIMAIRAQRQAFEKLPINPTDVLLPILISSFCATLIGILVVAGWQKILKPKLFLSLLGISAVIAGFVSLVYLIPAEKKSLVIQLIGNIFIFSIIISFIVAGFYKKIDVYGTFIDGAKEGFTTAIRILPYLVAMLVAIKVFWICGAMDFINHGVAYVISALRLNTDFVPALPIAFMKPLSGSGAQGLTVDMINSQGVNSFLGKLSSIMYASADTTFYIVALYFGSVGIKKTRYAITGGLIADFAGILAAILVAYLFFH